MGPIFLTIFISMIGFGIVIPVLPVYAKNAPFQLSPTELGALVGIFSLVQLFLPDQSSAESPIASGASRC